MRIDGTPIPDPSVGGTRGSTPAPPTDAATSRRSSTVRKGEDTAPAFAAGGPKLLGDDAALALVGRVADAVGADPATALRAQAHVRPHHALALLGR